MYKLSKYLKQCRIKASKTQVEVASELGYSSPQFISNVERSLCGYPLVKYVKLIPFIGANNKKVARLYMESIKQEIEEAVGLK